MGWSEGWEAEGGQEAGGKKSIYPQTQQVVVYPAGRMGRLMEMVENNTNIGAGGREEYLSADFADDADFLYFQRSEWKVWVGAGRHNANIGAG